MKKIIAILTFTATLLALCACGGGGGSTNSNIMEIGDITVQYKSFEILKDFEEEDAIAINYNVKNNGENKASFFVNLTYDVTQNGEPLDVTTIVTNSETFETMSDGIWEDIESGASRDVTITYVLNDLTTPVKVTFNDWSRKNEKSHTIEIAGAKIEAPATDGNTEQNTAEGSESSKYANTSWYGWWMVGEPTGEYADADGAYFDCCVRIEETDEGYLLMSLWDEFYPEYENCTGEIYYTEDEDGWLVNAEGGYFLNGEALAAEASFINPEFSENEDILFTTIDVEDETGSFVAIVQLMRWGTQWDTEFTDAPTYYDSYFLPLMEDGQPLPADISDIG